MFSWNLFFSEEVKNPTKNLIKRDNQEKQDAHFDKKGNAILQQTQ